MIGYQLKILNSLEVRNGSASGCLQQKANNSAPAAGVVSAEVSGGYVVFKYTPPAGVSTNATSSIVIYD